MKRIFAAALIFFCLIAINEVAHAREAASIKVNGKNYTFIIYSRDEYKNRIDFFNDEQKDDESKVADCSLIIDVPVGTARGNHSYGGFCKSRSGEEITICNDEMVGHYKRVLRDEADTDSDINELSKFVVENCYGG